MAKAKTPGGRQSQGAKPGQKSGAGAAPAQAVAVDTAPARPRVSPLQFLSQVRAEGRKIVWPSRKETWITSVMVFIMVALAIVFFWLVDMAVGWLAEIIVGLGL